MKTLPLTQLTVERLSLISEKPFASVLAAIRGGIGHPDMNKLWKEIWSADSFQRVESIVKAVLGEGLVQTPGEDAVSIVNKVAIGLLKIDRFTQLPKRPRRGRMRGDVRGIRRQASPDG